MRTRISVRQAIPATCQGFLLTVLAKAKAADPGRPIAAINKRMVGQRLDPFEEEGERELILTPTIPILTSENCFMNVLATY
jgi:hypothetical protein